MERIELPNGYFMNIYNEDLIIGKEGVDDILQANVYFKNKNYLNLFIDAMQAPAVTAAPDALHSLPQGNEAWMRILCGSITGRPDYELINPIIEAYAAKREATLQAKCDALVEDLNKYIEYYAASQAVEHGVIDWDLRHDAVQRLYNATAAIQIRANDTNNESK